MPISSEPLEAISEKLSAGDIYVQVTLDSTQAGCVHERAPVAKRDWVGNSLNTAIGRSEKSAVMHLTCVLIDGLDAVTGSTNWDYSAQAKQDDISWSSGTRS